MARCYPKEKCKDSIPCTFSALYSRTPPLERQVLENSSEQLHAGPMNPTLEFPHDKLGEETLIKGLKRLLSVTSNGHINVLQVLKA